MKDKRKIIKTRPFNMANFSGGSGYLVFSVIYQGIALIPATLAVWALTLVKLPKDGEGNYIIDDAARRFNKITIPFTVVFIVASFILSVALNYDDIFPYIIEIIIDSLVPAICAFFIIRRYHEKIVFDNMKISKAVLLSLGKIILSIIIVFCFSAFCLDPLLSSF